MTEETAQANKLFAARDIMHKGVPTIVETAPLVEAVKALGSSPNGIIVVTTAEGAFSGTLSNADLVKVMGTPYDPSASVKTLVPPSPPTVDSKKSIQHCLEVMLKKRVLFLPVVDNGVCLGLIQPLDTQKFLFNAVNDKIKEVQEAERKIDYRDEFISILAHDIRSPLNLINGCAVIINEMETANPTLSPEYRSLISQIQDSAMRSLNLVTDLLDIGRLNAGMKMNFQNVSVPKYMEQLAQPLKMLAARENIELVTDFSDEVEALIDPDRTAQIVDNLVNNAIKVSTGGKRIFLKAEFDGAEPEKSRLKISVRDEGPGIPADKLGMIFQKYRQLDGIGKSRGVGLGLSIVSQYVRLQNGEIDVIGGEGTGATFVVYLPNANRICVPNVPKILVVDDDEQILELISEEMVGKPFEIRYARDGKEALNILKTFSPNIVVTDLSMPNLDGIGLIGEVRKLFPKIPVIILSGHTNFLKIGSLASHLHVDLFLSKPFSTDDLESALTRILSAKKVA